MPISYRSSVGRFFLPCNWLVGRGGCFNSLLPISRIDSRRCQFIDRHGRTRMMGINTFGALFADLLVVFVFVFSAKLPGGYWFLIIAPIVEGGLGGQLSLHGIFLHTDLQSSQARQLP